jgi:serine/threonine protein kinase/tetratricopeptide (TPR) repeat protein
VTEREIFERALDVEDPSERAGFLDRACVDQPELRRQVDELLKAHELAGPFLDQPHPAAGVPEGTGPYASPSSPRETPGTVIAGKYKLLQQIGEGGMGSVWMADQLEPVKRRVALKLIRTEREGSRTILSRFEAERQAIALMDHPNIAKLLDAGTTGEPGASATGGGRPYFVMELVKGVQLTAFCDEHKLSIPDRLNLFVQICSAVQHAHQKGIIHRDLKPTNILVEMHDDRPVPRVIDFGLAKALSGQPLTEHTLFTGFGTVAGTPLYMAPEQAKFNAIDIDTRADIYALGVILYELLTGSTPIERAAFKQAAFDEILRVIRESEPPTPSKRLSSTESKPSVAANRQSEPQKLGRFVKGELDWIVMKALAKERDRRYETANGFARDIERFLNHEPVLAGPPSTRYRLRKFVQRNRGQVIACSLVLLALLLGIIGTTLGLIWAEHQRQIARANEKTSTQAKEREAEQREKAEKARDRTRQALDDMTSSITGDSLGTQKEISADQKKFLTEVLKYYQEFAGEKAEDEQARARTAQAASRVARIEHRLGRKAQAVVAMQMALDGFVTLAADFPAVPEYRQELSLSHHRLGFLLTDLEKLPEAEEQYRKALAIQEKLAADFPTEQAYAQDLSTSRSNLGTLLVKLGKRPEAEEQFRKSLAIRDKLAADYPTVPRHRQYLAASHLNLGTLLGEMGMLTKAAEHARSALAIREKLAADFPTEPEYNEELSSSYNNLGANLALLGKWPEAQEQYRKALAIRAKLVADFPAMPEYRRHLARTHTDLGILLAAQQKWPEAEEPLRQALAIREKLAADFPTVPEYQHDLADSLNYLGSLLSEMEKWPEAQEQLGKCLAIREKLAADFPTVPEHREKLAKVYADLGILLGELRKWPEAEEQYGKSLAIQEKLAADFSAVTGYQIQLGLTYRNLGRLLSRGGQPKKSLAWFAKAIRTLTLVFERDRRRFHAQQYLRNAHLGRALAHDRLQMYAEAVQDWDRVVALSPHGEQPGHRASRAVSRINAGQVSEAVTEVAELTKASSWTAGHWYDFACVYAVASGKAADKKQEYTDWAMALLHKAVKAGYKDAAHMKQDRDLDSLRGREDFKNLLAELTSGKDVGKKP